MNDRFKFNAVVSSYYDIDTPTNYEEHEPQFYLSDVDVFCDQEIGIDYDALFDAVKQQAKNLSEKEIGQIMQHFEDNSNSPECDFVTIKPDKILQCTGLKDKNGKLIYEGDIVKYAEFDWTDFSFKDWDTEIAQVVWGNTYDNYYPAFDLKDTDFDGTNAFSYLFNEGWTVEVIGNIYENKSLLESEG